MVNDLNIGLATLPKTHPLRNAPLAAIGAMYKHRDMKMWFEVLPSFHISKITYNQLGDSWLYLHDWKATKWI